MESRKQNSRKIPIQLPNWLADTRGLPNKIIIIDVIKETKKAFYVEVQDYGKSWLPKSQIKEVETLSEFFKNKSQDIVRLSDAVITLHIRYDEKLIDAIKHLEGSRWDDDDEIWKVPESEVDQVIKLAEKFDIEIHPEVENLEREISEIYRLSSSISSEKEIKVKGGNLYPFQASAVEYTHRIGGNVLIADQMGLGKTIESLAYVEINSLYPTLVIAPASLCINWRKEIERWVGRKAQVAESELKIEYDTEILISNYAKIWRNQNPEKIKDFGFKALIVDESHFIKNSEAQRSKAVIDIANEIDNVLLLTGTPILNRPVELVTQLKTLGKLTQFGGRWNFLQTYCDPTRNHWGWDFSGTTNIEKLQTKLRRTCMVRREKKDVLKELPEQRYLTTWFGIDNRKEYEECKNDLIEFLTKNARESKTYDQILNKQGEKQAEEYAKKTGLRAKRAEELVKMEKLKQIAAKGKMRSVIEWAKNVLDQDQKIVLFANHKEIINPLFKSFNNAVKLTGDMTQDDRNTSVEKFQEGEADIFIGSIRAAGHGLTLIQSHIVAFVELDWNKARHEQAADRVHRIGQEEDVQVYWLLADNTIEEDIKEMIDRKGEISDLITKYQR